MVSLSPDITERLPAAFSARTVSQDLAAGGAKWDVNIGGIGFILAAADGNPYQRESLSPVKDQVDTARDAGEQTLSGYWLRSQTSWHKGAGVNFYEPGTDETSLYRYSESVGVDVWTEGEATLLRATSRVNDQPAGGVPQYVTYSGGYLFLNDSGSVDRYKPSSGGWVFDVTLSTTNAAVGAAVAAGSALVVGTDTGVEICGDPFAASAAFDVEWTSSMSGGWTVAYVKDRVVAGHDNELRELSLAGGDLATVDPFYEHLDAGWVWVSVCEAGTAILAAGRSGDDTGVYAFTLVDPSGGGSPVLGAPTKVAVLPPGELIYAMNAYLGTYVGLGTTHGVRVGLLDGNGALQYGPLTVETTEPVRCLSGADRFLYAGVTRQIDGGSGAVRVDVSQPVDGLRFAWAWDAQTHTTGEVVSIALTPDTDPCVLLGATGQGVYAQADNVFEQTGYVLSGKVRFNTVEPKSFERADVRADTTGGKVAFAVVDDNGQEVTIYTLAAGAPGRNINVTFPDTVQEYVSVRLTLSGDGSATPMLRSWQLKAVPHPPSQRRILFPLMCFDRERTATGLAIGRDGFAWLRLSALEELQNKAASVMVQDFTNGETFDGVVEKVSFVRPSPRDTNGKSNFGGLLSVTVRKFDQ